MQHFFLDLIGREHRGGIDLRPARALQSAFEHPRWVPCAITSYDDLALARLDLLCPIRTAEYCVMIEIVMVDIPHTTIRPDLLEMLHNLSREIWHSFAHEAYEVDSTGRRLTGRAIGREAAEALLEKDFQDVFSAEALAQRPCCVLCGATITAEDVKTTLVISRDDWTIYCCGKHFNRSNPRRRNSLHALLKNVPARARPAVAAGIKDLLRRRQRRGG